MALPRRTQALVPRRPSGRRQPVAITRGALSNAADISLGGKLAALTAAAVRVRSDNSGQMRRLVQPWQILALAYYDQVGECWAPANFYGRALKKVRLFAGERDGDGEITETDNPQAQEVVKRIQDPGGGGYSQLLESYGKLKFLIGEGYFLVTNPEGDDERWEFVSPDELRVNGGSGKDTYTRFVAPSLPAEELDDVPDDSYDPLPGTALVYRVWRPHPRYSRLADSALRSQLKTLEELQLLSLAIGATAKNRMAVNGILYLSERLVPSAIDPGADEDPNHETFMRELTQQIVSPIVNPGTAAAAAPVILIGPDMPAGEMIQWVQISDPTNAYPEEGIRTELIRRFAVGIDWPAELLTGMADSNHWTNWLIDEQAARDYVFPVCDELTTELTSIFMRPVLKKAGVEDFDRFVIGYDAAAVIAHPNQAADAKDAHDRIVISDARYREALNFNDGDAPDEEEWQRRAALKMLDPSALTDPYNVEPAPVGRDEQQEGEEGAPQGAEGVRPGAPDTQPSGDSTDVQEQMRAQVLGACRVAVHRSRELAGSRLRSRLAAGNGDTPPAAKDTPNDRLAATLGADWVRTRAARTELDLVAGGTRILTVALRDLGLSTAHADRIAAMVATHAARTLYQDDPGPLPRGLVAVLDRGTASVAEAA